MHRVHSSRHQERRRSRTGKRARSSVRGAVSAGALQNQPIRVRSDGVKGGSCAPDEHADGVVKLRWSLGAKALTRDLGQDGRRCTFPQLIREGQSRCSASTSSPRSSYGEILATRCNRESLLRLYDAGAMQGSWKTNDWTCSRTGDQIKAKSSRGEGA
jgi:hypothetical protein